MGQVSDTRREITLFMGGDSVPFRPRHARVHQSPRIDEDTAEQWPCCGPIKSLRLWHLCLTLASGNENYSSDSLLLFFFFFLQRSYKAPSLSLMWVIHSALI